MIQEVSFGIFVFFPQGWLFMTLVILIECIIMTKILKKNWFDIRIYGFTALTNVISGIGGLLISMVLTNFQYIVVWFPWVGSTDFNPSNTESLNGLIILYAVAFILSVLLELFTNWKFLWYKFETKQILTATLITNIASYTIGTILLYSYSFG